MAQKSRQEVRRAVHRRIRKKVHGTAARPRLAVFRSLNHIYAQVIDDEKGVTLCVGVNRRKGGRTRAAISRRAKVIGRLIAERAKEKGITASSSIVAARSITGASGPWQKRRVKPGLQF